MKKLHVSLIALLSILSLNFLILSSEGYAEGEQKANPKPQPVNVSTIEIQPRLVRQRVSLPGRIATVRQAEVRPQVSGILLERLFEEGGKVEAGQLLYRLDDTRNRAALEKAKADLASAKTNISLIESKTRRYEKLAQNGAVSQQGYEDAKIELEQAYANIEVAKAQLKIAQVNLEYTQIRAPISGIIGRTLVSEGALVTENQSQVLAEITQLDPIYADLQITLEQKRRLDHLRSDSDQPSSVRLDLPTVGSDYEYAGVLKFTEVLLNTSTDSLTLRAEFANPNAELIPGQFVEAHVLVPERSLLLLPQRATARDMKGQLTVWVVNDSVASQRIVDVEGSFEDQWIIEKGLTAGDQVVVTGYQKLRPDALVNSKPWVQAGQGGQ